MLNRLLDRVRKRQTPDRDGRSRRLVAVIECTLNQNARDAGAATFQAMNSRFINLCDEYNIGILQMPCPEIACLGFSRTRRPGQSIKDALDSSDGRCGCRKISADVADRIEIYLARGYRILAIIGGNPESPGCAIHKGTDRLLPSSGIFMQELEKELHRRCIKVPFRGMRDYDAALFARDIDWVRAIFSQPDSGS